VKCGGEDKGKEKLESQYDNGKLHHTTVTVPMIIFSK
jgi:hypothetical protein